MLKPIPDHSTSCWFLDDDEFKNLNDGRVFAPVYQAYAYFKLISRFGEDTIEVHLGQKEITSDYYETIDLTFDIFRRYQDHQPVYLTLDKRTIYRIHEIVPTKPLSFILKKVTQDTNVQASERIQPMITVQPLNFEPLFGGGFERLVNAYLHYIQQDVTIQWLGESGQDQGRDIWVIDGAKTTCYQCANYRTLTFEKSSSDIDKLVLHGHLPDRLVVVCGGNVSAALRSKVESHAKAVNIPHIEIWSAAEFEEKLRNHAQPVLDRFFNGVVSPHQPQDQTSGQLPESEDAALLEISLAPVFGIKGDDEEIGVFIEEAFYNIKSGKTPAVIIQFAEESILAEKAAQLSKEPRTAANRRQTVALAKIGDLLKELRKELEEKIKLLYYADLYPVKEQYERLAGVLRQLLLISITPKRLYEETELPTILHGEVDGTSALKYRGSVKLDLMRPGDHSIGFSIWLPQHEFDELLSKWRVPKEHLRMLSVWGIECSDLKLDTIVQKAIPAYIDNIYELKYNRDKIDADDNSSWTYLPAYVIGMG